MAINCMPDDMTPEQQADLVEKMKEIARSQGGADPDGLASPRPSSQEASDIPTVQDTTATGDQTATNQTGQPSTGTPESLGITLGIADSIAQDARQRTQNQYGADPASHTAQSGNRTRGVTPTEDVNGEEVNLTELDGTVVGPSDPPGWWSGFKAGAIEWLRPGGNLGADKQADSWFNSNQAEDGYSRIITDDALSIAEGFDAGLKSEDFRTQDVIQQLHTALRTEYDVDTFAGVYTNMAVAMNGGETIAETQAAFQSLKPQTRTVLAMMRKNIDTETQNLIEIVDQEMLLLKKELELGVGTRPPEYIKVTRTIYRKLDQMLKAMERSVERVQKGGTGDFIHRAYMYSSDPKFRKKAQSSIELQGDARRFFAKMYRYESAKNGVNPSQQQVNDFVGARIQEVFDVMNNNSSTSLHTTNSDAQLKGKIHAFKHHADIPLSVRKMLGEIKDPGVNYAVTIQQQHLLRTSIQFAQQMIASGKKYGTMSDQPTAAHNTLIKDPGNTPAIFMLSNLYTTPQFEQAIQEHFTVIQQKGIIKGFQQAASLVKTGKTLWSPATAIRNWMSAAWMLGVNNGYNMDGFRQSKEVIDGILRGSNASDYMNLLLEKGVVGDGIGHRGLQKLSRDTGIFDDNTVQAYVGLGDFQDIAKIKGSKFKNIHEWRKFALRFYQGADDFPKVVLFEKNRSILARAYDTDINNQRVIDEAAWRVRNTLFTYSKVPKVIKELQSLPVAGPFISFPAEVIRTSYNWLRIVAQDINSGNNVLAVEAYKRIISATATAVITEQLFAEVLQQFSDITDDEAETIQIMAGRFEKNDNIIPIAKHEDGTYEVINMARYNPYSIIRNSVHHIFNGEDPLQSVVDSAFTLIEPFIQTDILTKSIVEAIGKATDDSARDVLGDSVVFLETIGKGITPTLMQQIYRTANTIGGDSFEYGTGEREPSREALKIVGATSQLYSIPKQLQLASYDYTSVRNDAEKEVRSVAKDINPNGLLPSALIAADIQAVQASMQDKWGEFSKKVNHLKTRGYSNAELSQLLQLKGAGKGAGGGIRKEEMGRLLRGMPAPDLKYPSDAAKTYINQVRVLSGTEAASQVARKIAEQQQAMKLR